MNRAFTVAVVVVLLCALASCSSDAKDCQAQRCVAVLRLDLRDPSGNRVVSNVLITSQSADPSFDPIPCADTEACSYSVTHPSGDLSVAAMGYQPVVVHYQPESDACGNERSQTVQITLAPSNASTSPNATTTLSASCG